MKSLLQKSMLAIACLLCSIGVNAHDFEVDGIYYNITNTSPNQVEVTFRGNYYNSYENEYTGTVVIPESVTYRGTTYSVNSISNSAFDDCTKVKKLTIEDSDYELNLGYNSSEEGLFYDCPIETLYIGRNLSYSTGYSYGYSPFYKIEELKTVTIGNSVTSIGDYIFRDCQGLTEITIPDNVTEIGHDAFHRCTGLISVIIGNGVTSIGDEAFSRCTGLAVFTIPNSVSMLGEGIFYECTGLRKVTIGNSVAEIGDETFYNCRDLTKVTIPNSVTLIGNSAFYGCRNLIEVIIGDSITEIGDKAFYDCVSLTEIYIPNSVISIGNNSFMECISLTKITLGNSLISIGDHAFGYCNSIRTIYTKSIQPPTIEANTFTTDVYSDAKLYVPYGTIDEYEKAQYWSCFAIIEEEFSAVKDIVVDTNSVTSEYYDLSGHFVKNPSQGIYIIKQGNTVQKVIVNKK